MAHLLFLSHAGADTDRALKLVAAIEASPAAQKHGLKVWLDKRPDGPHRLHAGSPWQDQLERAIATESTAFGLLLTREGARNWVRLEVRVALDRVIAEQRAGAVYPFVPIIADDPGDLAHLPPFAQQYQGVRLTADGQGLADLVRVAARLGTAQPVRLVAQPFMGLEAFEAKDAALFFGRRGETKALVDRLRTTNLILVTGDSGSGKSSLVKAGLIPAFREGALADPLGRRPEPGQWHVVEMRPGTDPFEGLVEGIGKAAGAAGKSLADQGTLNDWVRTCDPDKIRDALRESGPPGASLLLVVDQFEELWTLTTDDSKRRDFLAALLALVPEGDLARRVVGTMRRDYYHLHTDDERLRDRLAAQGNAGRFLLGAMAPESLRDIVEKPLLLAGESEIRAGALADEVVKDVTDEPGNLALVEMALHESWERRHESSGDLALSYQRLDRLEGALARAAEEVFWNPSKDPNKLTEHERPIAEALFMRLVHAGDAGGATRRPVAYVELDEPTREVARKLANRECRRLLVLHKPAGDVLGEEAVTVELAHEQLVTQWPDYRFWLRGTATTRHQPDTTRASDKRTFDRCMGAAASWRRRGRRAEDLARGGDLAEFKRIRAPSRRDLWLSAIEREFIDCSIEASVAAERSRKQRSMVGVFAFLLLLFLFGLSLWQWRSAELARVEARGQAVAAEANKRLAEAQLREAKRVDSLRLANLSLQATRSGDALTGILLALQALPSHYHQPDRPIVDRVWPALRTALSELRETRIFNLADIANSASSILHTSLIVKIDSNGKAVVWSADNNKAVTLPGHDYSRGLLAFSPDKTRVLTRSTDGQVRVGPVDGSREPTALPGHSGILLYAVFSPDGTRVLTVAIDVSPDGSDKPQIWLRIGPADGSSEPVTLAGYNDPIRAVAFSPDGAQVLAVTSDGQMTVGPADKKHEPTPVSTMYGSSNVFLNVETWQMLSSTPDGQLQIGPIDGRRKPIILQDHEDRSISTAVFSPDGTRVIVADHNGTARLWHTNGRGGHVVLRGHDGPILAATFSPDGRQVVTASADNTARIWPVNDGGEPVILRGHEGPVRSAAFSPDGTRIITASDDQTARIWAADGSVEPVILRGHGGSLSSAAFSSNGVHVLSISEDKTLRVWRALGKGRPSTLRGHGGWVRAVSFSADGTRFVTASDDKTARVWSMDGGKSKILRGHQGPVYSATFSPDGTKVLTASGDGTARIWSIKGDSAPIILRGHDGPVWTAAFSRDGARVVTASWDQTARVWPANGGTPLVLRGHRGSINSATFSADGSRIATASDDKTARIWQTNGTSDAVILVGHTDVVRTVDFNPDGSQVMTASADGTVRLWSTSGFNVRKINVGRAAEPMAATFNTDGSSALIPMSNGTSALWPTHVGSTPIYFRGHESWVTAARLSPGGSQIASCSADGTARVWNIDGSDSPQILRGHSGWVVAAAFSPDGANLVTASQDGTARIWLVNELPEAPNELLAFASSLELPRQLTDSQKKQYFIIDDW